MTNYIPSMCTIVKYVVKQNDPLYCDKFLFWLHKIKQGFENRIITLVFTILEYYWQLYHYPRVGIKTKRVKGNDLVSFKVYS